MTDQNKNIAKKFLTLQGVPRRLIISELTVYNKVSNGTFPIRPIRIGCLLRCRVEALNKYIESF